MRIVDIVAAIENDGCTRTLMDRLRELEAKQDELTERLSNTLADLPDIHPNVAGIYRRKVGTPRGGARKAPGARRGGQGYPGPDRAHRACLWPEMSDQHATLHGDLNTILESTAHTGQGNRTGTSAPGLSVSVVAGARNHRDRHSLIISI